MSSCNQHRTSTTIYVHLPTENLPQVKCSKVSGHDALGFDVFAIKHQHLRLGTVNPDNRVACGHKFRPVTSWEK